MSVTIPAFGAGATARRQLLLRAVAKVVPGLTYKRFDYDRPSRFTVSAAGQEITLTLGQVEVFAAAVRLGFELGRRQLKKGDVPKIAAHQFD